jgi:hypothetical protein
MRRAKKAGPDGEIGASVTMLLNGSFAGYGAFGFRERRRSVTEKL